MHFLVSGMARMGKDTLANYLCPAINEQLEVQLKKDLEKFVNAENKVAFNLANYMKYYRCSFAAKVKQIFADAFNVDLDFIEEWKVKDEIPEGFEVPVRTGLKEIGSGFRKIQKHIWIRTLFEDKRPNKVISDGRYINELKKVKDEGGVNILLWRPGFENDDPNDSEAQMRGLTNWFKDQSLPKPYGADLVDFFIVNDGTLEDLYRKGREAIFPLLFS